VCLSGKKASHTSSKGERRQTGCDQASPRASAAARTELQSTGKWVGEDTMVLAIDCYRRYIYDTGRVRKIVDASDGFG
jgi:hypothetical protein